MTRSRHAVRRPQPRPFASPRLARLAGRLPQGRDGRPLQARHRLGLAAVLLFAFLATLGPAMDALTTSFVGTPQAAAPIAAPKAVAPVAPVAAPAAPAAPAAAVVAPAVAPVAYVLPVQAAAAAARPAAYAVPAAPAPAAPGDPTTSPGTGIKIDVGVGQPGRSQAVNIIILMTVLSVAPALLLMCTSFTKIAIVLSLTRNALGTPTIPPNQVLAGIALFLSLFVMGPVLQQTWEKGVEPFTKSDTMTIEQAVEAGGAPLKMFMANHTGDTELQTMVKLSKSAPPANKASTEWLTLIPAFVLSELKSAFIIGFVIFIPFLVVDLVVSSVLMSMGMMMLPPVMISLPFKLLLFVMVDGWSLITTALVTSYR